MGMRLAIWIDLPKKPAAFGASFHELLTVLSAHFKLGAVRVVWCDAYGRLVAASQPPSPRPDIVVAADRAKEYFEGAAIGALWPEICISLQRSEPNLVWEYHKPSELWVARSSGTAVLGAMLHTAYQGYDLLPNPRDPAPTARDMFRTVPPHWVGEVVPLQITMDTAEWGGSGAFRLPELGMMFARLINDVIVRVRPLRLAEGPLLEDWRDEATAYKVYYRRTADLAWSLKTLFALPHSLEELEARLQPEALAASLPGWCSSLWAPGDKPPEGTFLRLQWRPYVEEGSPPSPFSERPPLEGGDTPPLVHLLRALGDPRAGPGTKGVAAARLPFK